MDELEILRVQARRKASELHEALALEPSGRVIAVFKNDQYGVFAIDGDIARSTSFFVGGIELGNNGKATRDLVLLTPDDGSLADGAERPIGDTVPLDTLPGAISPGDVVRAHFEQQPYGAFSITGVAVKSPRSDDLLVGSWFITSQLISAARLVRIELLAPASAHDIPAPRAMTSWAADNEAPTLDS